MGRRALPKVDQTIDVSAHHVFLDDLPCPLDVEAFFARSAPLEIELGSGKGLFMLNASRNNPDRDYLGVETAKKYAQYAAYRFAKADLTNARMVSGDGIRLMDEFIPDEVAAAVHVYFPDPWWKERHRRRRIMQPDVVKNIERVLISGGEFQFWTDVEEYFETAMELMAAETKLQGPFEVPETAASDDMDYRTHFERRMRLNDHPVFRSRFVKA